MQQFIVYGKIPIYPLSFLVIYGVLAGRFFCGWGCPVGAFQDFITYLKGEKNFKPTNFWYTKFFVLILTPTLAWIGHDLYFCKVCFSGSLFASIPFYLLNPTYKGYGFFFYLHIFILVAFVVLAYFKSRFWCKYICPIGAFYGFFNRLSMVKIKFNKEKCENCGLCLNVCVMGLKRMENFGVSTNCILCGRCVEHCPKKALKFTF